MVDRRDKKEPFLAVKWTIAAIALNLVFLLLDYGFLKFLAHR